MTNTNSCYSVFQHLIKSLCLKEFPCGIGSWRNPNDKYADNFSSVTSADYGVGYEKMETLMEYLKSGTWDVDTNWSEEARSLQNMAVVEPRKLEGEKGDRFVHGYFRTLRMVDKEIHVVGPELLLLRNLENLTLSVNHIIEVPSQNLPRKLKVLELCMNQIDSVVPLCKKPPPLEHLGLSYNRLHDPDEYKYFTAKYWPHLLSLDLSHNNFEHLVALVDQLSSLPQLRSLVLQGNPLSMIPGYRGYTLDVLRELMIFDDVSVTADERHRFKGLARRRENIRNVAQLSIAFETLGGINMPDELKDVETRDEFPIVTSHYIVRYQMLGFPDVISETPQIRIESNLGSEVKLEPTPYPHGNVQTELEVDVQPEQVAEGDVPEDPGKDTADIPAAYRVTNYSSEPLSWGKWIDLNYRFEHEVTDLRAFRDFIRCGLQLEVFHKKTSSWPLEKDPTPEAPKSRSPKGSASKTKDGKNKGKSAKDKGKKKAPEAAQELRSDPPVYEKLGGCDVPFTFLLEGGDLLEEVFYCGGGPMIPIDELRKIQEADRLQAEEATKVESKKKPRTASASSKGKDKKGEVKEEVGEQEPPPPRPLTLAVKVELKKWSTAVESLDP